MSTSDQQGQGPLTRKQLRELRMTGSTPVIDDTTDAADIPDEAVASDEAPSVSVPPVPPLPRAAEPFEAPAPQPEAPVDSDAPLTRRQARELERSRTGSVPIVDDAESAVEHAEVTPPPVIQDAQEVASHEPAAYEPAELASVVTAVPDFSVAVPSDDIDDADEEVAAELVAAPVSAAPADLVTDVELVPEPIDEVESDAEPEDAVAAVAALGIEVPDDDDDDDAVDPDDVLADVRDTNDADITGDAHPTVSTAFGAGVLNDTTVPPQPFAPSFDELLTVGDSTGSHHVAPNTLIFTPSPGEGSLSGPVAATGEILVTGSYELPAGLGSQGHAHGTTDGKDVDAVLIDGELPPASSPTPIAASAAISTIKPAGEIIRPPAPEKGNRLMLTLAIVAGGLALAVGVVLIIAFTTNVLA